MLPITPPPREYTPVKVRHVGPPLGAGCGWVPQQRFVSPYVATSPPWVSAACDSAGSALLRHGALDGARTRKFLSGHNRALYQIELLAPCARWRFVRRSCSGPGVATPVFQFGKLTCNL